MKKLIVTIICMVIISVFLTACITIDTTTETKHIKEIYNDEETGSYTKIVRDANWKPEEPTNEELSFFVDEIEAIKNNTFGEEFPNISEKDIVRRLDSENNSILFVRLKNRKDHDAIYALKLRKIIKQDTILYSQPIYGIPIAWQGQKWWQEEGIAKRYEANEVLKEVVITDLQGIGALGGFHLEENDGFVYWGFTDIKEVKNLTINGESPTEVVKLDMDGEVVYFWYYRHLDIDYQNMEELEILY